MEPVPTRQRQRVAALGCFEAYTAVIGLNVHDWQPIEAYKPAWADKLSVPGMSHQSPEPARDAFRTRNVVVLVGERGDSKKRPTYCADDSMRRASAASSMWRPGCQLFLAFVRSQSTQTRKSRACISRSHGPTTTPTSPTCAEHRGPNGLKFEKQTTHDVLSRRRLISRK